MCLILADQDHTQEPGPHSAGSTSENAVLFLQEAQPEPRLGPGLMHANTKTHKKKKTHTHIYSTYMHTHTPTCASHCMGSSIRRLVNCSERAGASFTGSHPTKWNNPLKFQMPRGQPIPKGLSVYRTDPLLCNHHAPVSSLRSPGSQWEA